MHCIKGHLLGLVAVARIDGTRIMVRKTDCHRCHAQSHLPIKR